MSSPWNNKKLCKAIENDRRSSVFLIQFFKYIDPDHKYSPLQIFQLTSATIDAHVTRNDLTSAIEKNTTT